MTLNTPLRFEYRLSSGNAALMVLAAATTTVGIGYIAYTSPNFGLVRMLSRLFSPQTATAFFWILTAICLAATVFVVLFASKSRSAASYVELGTERALLPSATVSMSLIPIPYNVIREIQLINNSNHKMIVISSSLGEVRLLSKFFAKDEEFAKFFTEIERRCRI